MIFQFLERVYEGRNHEHRRRNMPFKLIEPGDEGIGEDKIVVDERTSGATSALGNAPAENLTGAGEDLVAAMGVLEVDLISVATVPEAAGLDDGEELPADLGLFLLSELDRNDAGGEMAVEHAPEAFADAGSVDDNVLRFPGLVEVLDLAEDIDVLFTDPAMAGKHMIGGVLQLR